MSVSQKFFEIFWNFFLKIFLKKFWKIFSTFFLVKKFDIVHFREIDTVYWEHINKPINRNVLCKIWIKSQWFKNYETIIKNLNFTIWTQNHIFLKNNFKKFRKISGKQTNSEFLKFFWRYYQLQCLSYFLNFFSSNLDEIWLLCDNLKNVHGLLLHPLDWGTIFTTDF